MGIEPELEGEAFVMLSRTCVFLSVCGVLLASGNNIVMSLWHPPFYPGLQCNNLLFVINVDRVRPDDYLSLRSRGRGGLVFSAKPVREFRLVAEVFEQLILNGTSCNVLVSIYRS